MKRPDRNPRWTAAFGYAAALLSGLLMGVTWVVLKVILNAGVLGPADLNWLSVAGVLAIVLPVHLLRHRRNLLPRESPWGWLLVFALLASGIFYLRNLGVGICGATTAAIVSRVETAFVFLLTYLVLRQPVGRLGWVGSLLLLAGALRTAGVGSATVCTSAAGVIALAGAALLIALNAVIIKTQFARVSNELVIVSSAAVQTVLYSLAVPVLIGLHGVRASFADPPLLRLVALAGLLIAANLFTYYYAMKRVPMWAARMLALLAPPVAVLADYLVLGTPVTGAALQGLVLVLGGAALVIVSGRQANGARPAAQEATYDA